MIIDIFTHIIPADYYRFLEQKASAGKISLDGIEPLVRRNRALSDVEYRLQELGEFPEMVQVLTLLGPPIEIIAKPEDAVDLAMIANNSMAEIVKEHPDRFVAAIASLHMNNIETALQEIDRAIKELDLRGILIYTDINGKPLDTEELMPVYEKMEQFDLPIFIHPVKEATEPDYPCEKGAKYNLNAILGWPHATSLAMMRLAGSGVLERYPKLKFITHHAGGTVPYLAKRIECSPYKFENLSRPITDSLRLFYNDTAVQGNTPNLMCAHAFFGAGHLIFGTDFPMSDTSLVKETIRSVREMNITDKEREDILKNNAAQLLGLRI